MPLSAPSTEKEKNDLRTEHFLQHPSQQAVVENYLRGNATSDQLVDELLTDILKRAPAIEQQLKAAAHERAERIREEQEMDANMKKGAEPTFIRVAPPKPAPSPTSKPVSEDTTEDAPVSDSLNTVEIEPDSGPLPTVARVEADGVEDQDFTPPPAYENDENN